MADRLNLSNDSYDGYNHDEEVFTFRMAQENSALTGSALVTLAGPMRSAGRVVDFAIGIVKPAVSASGFVSADISAQLRINSVAVCSTGPSIAGPVGSAGQAVLKVTNSGGGVSAVINTASASFSKGGMLTLDYNCLSVGSAAAGAAGVGLFAQVTVRYAAR